MENHGIPAVGNRFNSGESISGLITTNFDFNNNLASKGRNEGVNDENNDIEFRFQYPTCN